MKKLSKMTLLHVEKMSDSEMKQILGGNSLATLSSDNCYEEYISTDPPEAYFYTKNLQKNNRLSMCYVN